MIQGIDKYTPNLQLTCQATGPFRLGSRAVRQTRLRTTSIPRFFIP